MKPTVLKTNLIWVREKEHDHQSGEYFKSISFGGIQSKVFLLVLLSSRKLPCGLSSFSAPFCSLKKNIEIFVGVNAGWASQHEEVLHLTAGTFSPLAASILSAKYNWVCALLLPPHLLTVSKTKFLWVIRTKKTAQLRTLKKSFDNATTESFLY